MSDVLKVVQPTPNPPQPNGFGGVGPDNATPVGFHTHDGINSPKLDFSSFLGTGELTGTITTTSAIPKSVGIFNLSSNKALYVLAKISAYDGSTPKFAGFVRAATYKNNAGTVTVIDQIQDLFTMRNVSTWDVDFKVSGIAISLRVHGQASKTIVWNYSVKLVPLS